MSAPLEINGPPELITVFNHLNETYFGGKLSATLAWSSRMRVIAGSCNWQQRVIRLSVRHHQKYPEDIATTMMHEMLHLHLKRGHDEVFYQAATSLGVPIKSRGQAERRPFKYIYACPKCGRQIKRRIKGDWSCATCGNGEYNPRFRLRIIAYLPGTSPGAAGRTSG